MVERYKYWRGYSLNLYTFYFRYVMISDLEKRSRRQARI